MKLTYFNYSSRIFNYQTLYKSFDTRNFYSVNYFSGMFCMFRKRMLIPALTKNTNYCSKCWLWFYIGRRHIRSLGFVRISVLHSSTNSYRSFRKRTTHSEIESQANERKEQTKIKTEKQNIFAVVFYTFDPFSSFLGPFRVLFVLDVVVLDVVVVFISFRFCLFLLLRSGFLLDSSSFETISSVRMLVVRLFFRSFVHLVACVMVNIMTGLSAFAASFLRFFGLSFGFWDYVRKIFTTHFRPLFLSQPETASIKTCQLFWKSVGEPDFLWHLSFCSFVV